MAKLMSVRERLYGPDTSAFGRQVHLTFEDWIKNLDLKANSKALSVSVGDGVWDYTVFKLQPKITEISATDIVDNPVKVSDRKLLGQLGKWSFVKVSAENPLPFPDKSFDLIFHLDVIEHVAKPYSFLSDQYRLLKKGGYLIVGTPNLFRPANLVKLLIGKLKFPAKMGEEGLLGDCVHVQEFSQVQLKNMFEEVGFKIIGHKECFFGLTLLNLKFKDFPQSHLGQSLCQYLMFQCKK